MNLLFTGASGFLGRNICFLLKEKYKIDTMGLALQDNYKVDIAQEIPTLNMPYDVVLHAAGKAHSITKTEV